MDLSSEAPYSLAPGSQMVWYSPWLKVSVAPSIRPHLPMGTRSMAGGPAARSLAAG
jgi:hypothetical protein